MFVVRVQLSLQPQLRDEFRQWVSAAGLEARSMPGCVDYTFGEDVTNPLRVLLYEEWSSRQAFDDYKSSPLFSATGQHLRPMLSEPPKSAYYQSENVFGK